MNDKHILYGTEFSLYSGKARSYLRYKRIPYDEVLSSLGVYRETIIPKTGVRFIPVVKTPDGHYLQDTSNIIDSLEQSFPERSVMPDTPCQHLAALLLELYGDEWLLMPAMHYRWNFDNFPFIYDEFGRCLSPRWPGFVRRILGKRIGARFRGFLPLLGITDANRDALEDWYEKDFLQALDRHFKDHDFLFGGRPSIGDFGLIGPLYAHLYRDPYPGTLMRRDAPNVAAWVERMIHPTEQYGEWLAHDEVPETLTPIFKRMFAEHWPVLTATATELGQWATENEGPEIPRNIGEHQFFIGGVEETRAILPGSIWKMQRPLDCYASFSDSARQKANVFLEQVGGLSALKFQPPARVTRINNKLNLDPENSSAVVGATAGRAQD